MTSREAIVLPGGQFGPFAPLLMFCADAAERRDATLTPVQWTEPDRPLTLTPEERGPWVLEQVEQAVPSLRSADQAVDRADHGMYVPGPLAASTAVLGQVATAAEKFLDDVIWRSGVS